MSHHQPESRPSRHTRSAVLALLVAVTGAFVFGLGHPTLADSSSAASPRAAESVSERLHELLNGERHRERPGDPPSRPQSNPNWAPDVTAGALPDSVTVFDEEYPAVSNLDPALLGALRKAATDAAGEGVQLHVNGGWRSPEHQARLLDEAVAEYGSAEEAARWVATPATSPHVSGDAVDIGGSDATSWLSQHGSAYGLCQIYRNEPWHYELRRDAVDHGCRPMYDDPTDDPRMRH